MDTTPDPRAVPRATAAAMLGVTTHALRAWASADPPRGPRAVKLGQDRRSRVLYPVEEIRDWLADPVGYERRRRHPNARRR